MAGNHLEMQSKIAGIIPGVVKQDGWELPRDAKQDCWENTRPGVVKQDGWDHSRSCEARLLGSFQEL
jgi:hypothetical protein